MTYGTKLIGHDLLLYDFPLISRILRTSESCGYRPFYFSFAEYREDVKKKLTEKKETEARDKKEEAVIEAIIADAKMEIPDAMLETQQRQMVEDFAQRLSMQGLTLEQYYQFTGLDHDKMLVLLIPCLGLFLFGQFFLYVFPVFRHRLKL